MKMILAILRDTDTEVVTQALVAADFHVTRIASTGGFLRRGQSTLLIGVEDDCVDQAIGVIRASAAPPAEGETRRAALFVIPVDHFSQI